LLIRSDDKFDIRTSIQSSVSLEASMQLRSSRGADLTNNQHRASSETWSRMNLRKISQVLEDAGHHNEHERRFIPRRIKAMLEH